VIFLPNCAAGTVWRNPQDRYYRNYNSGEEDASIAAATMMCETEELGVHSVWLRGFDSAAVAETFDLPENMIPVMMFAWAIRMNEASRTHGISDACRWKPL